MALQLFQLQIPIPIPTSSAQFLHHTRHRHSHLLLDGSLISHNLTANISLRRRRRRDGALLAGSEDTELRVTPPLFEDRDEGEEDDKEEEDDLPPSPEDLEYVREIQRVVELLKKNRDMLFSEIKLTIMIEDPREVERRRLLGIEDLDAPTRDELAEALEEVVKEGKVPKNRAALRLLAEEMINWPNLEQAEVKKPKRGKSMYAKATDTGIAPEVAAKRLNIDWDSAAEIEDTNDSEENEVPAALGYGALYLVSAFPVIIAADDVPAAMISRAPGEHYSQDSELLSVEEPQAYMRKERQISVDPKSLQEPCPDPYHGEASFNFMLKPVKTSTAQLHPPPILPAKPKFLSCSLPNSAASSPRLSSSLFKRKSKNDSPASPRQVEKPDRQHQPHQGSSLWRSTKNDSPASPRQVEKLDLQHQPHQGSSLWRSKSCGDGRSSAVYDEFVLPKVDTNIDQLDKGNIGNFTKAGLKAKDHPSDEEFKCGSLCLFLPGFGKGKPVRPRKEKGGGGAAEVEDVVSRTVSMEKFECGSWASSAIVNDYNEEDEGDSKNLYFDLPLELIRNNGIKNEASCPVSAAFVFDKERKGVLKNVNTKGTSGKSHESGRHVRFSVSSPSSVSSPGGSCMTPRLRKAREDFSAYLEAQSA